MALILTLFFSINQDDQPDQTAKNHQAAKSLAAAHAEQVDASEVSVWLAEEFDEEAEQTVAHQVEAGHFVAKLWNSTCVVQNSEKDDSLKAHFVKLAGVV